MLSAAAALGGRVRTRGADVLELMREAGAAALAIVAIVNGLIGGILAFVGAVQLRRFGAEIYVADLVGIAMVREMAAVMTAIVMAGRTGGAFAAQHRHHAGQRGDRRAARHSASRCMDFLVLPRILALVAMMPLLYLYACAVGLLGGLVVGIGDARPHRCRLPQRDTAGRLPRTQFALGLDQEPRLRRAGRDGRLPHRPDVRAQRRRGGPRRDQRGGDRHRRRHRARRRLRRLHQRRWGSDVVTAERTAHDRLRVSG